MGEPPGVPLLHGPVLLCGLGTVGWRVLEALHAAGVPVVAVDSAARPDDPRLRGVQFIPGNFAEEAVLRAAGIADLHGVIIVTSDDLLNISTGLLVRRLNPDVRIVLRMFNRNLIARLGKAVTNVTALSVSGLAAPMLALAALTGELMAAFPFGDQRRQITEIEIAEGSPLAGRAFGLIDPTRRLFLLAHFAAGGEPRLLRRASRQIPLRAGDRIVVCGDPAEIGALRDPAGSADGVRWAGSLRRLARVAYRTLRETDKPVVICLSVLFSVIAGSTAAFRFGGVDLSWADAFYRTINVVTTGSDLGEEKSGARMKVFVGVLKLTSIALIAAFTAIVTNYLIKMRLGAAFESRRIPDANHIVVCGLGNVGFRVVEELLKSGEEKVVVLEKNKESAFVSSTRRRGAAVVIGDGTVPDVLKQCRVETARAVVVATSLELVNLEIALLVAELNPKQRVVVRLGDTLMADTVRRAANVKLALSLPELAAPAFVAGLFGDRVLAIFPLGGELHAVLEWSIVAGDEFVGSKPAQLDSELGFFLLRRRDTAGNPVPLESSLPLTVGERLTFIAPLHELEKLLKKPG